MNQVCMSDVSIEKKCIAIVMFGPATTTSGFRPAEYYQVTLDPRFVSPSGEYIRFGQTKGDELVGWQRVDAITICEVLAQYPEEVEGAPTVTEVQIPMTAGTFKMRKVVSEP